MCSRCVTDDSARGAFNRVSMIEPWQGDDRAVTTRAPARRARVAPGLLELAQDVADRRHAEGGIGELLRPQATQERAVAEDLLAQGAQAILDAVYLGAAPQ